jgi:uncharacterized protein (TIGR00156 family)
MRGKSKMTKLLLQLTLMCVLLHLSICENAESQNGFKRSQDDQMVEMVDPQSDVGTVTEALGLDIGSSVILEGHIENMIGEETYMFQDQTGNIVVRIRKLLFEGKTITPENTVEIQGKTIKIEDGGQNSVEVDVRHLAVVD